MKRLLWPLPCSWTLGAAYFSLNPPVQPLRLALLCSLLDDKTQEQRPVAQSLVQNEGRIGIMGTRPAWLGLKLGDF
jgi:hypothetical protein